MAVCDGNMVTIIMRCACLVQKVCHFVRFMENINNGKVHYFDQNRMNDSLPLWGTYMGRPKLIINEAAILEMREQGKSVKEISENLGIGTATLSRRIAELKYKKGILTKYRELQGLRLTELQARVLMHITPEKMEEASALDLIKCVYILAKAEKAIDGKKSIKVSGLLEHLLELERREKEY